MSEPTANDLHALLRRLYPITRSITGDGVRQTLSIINEIADFKVHEYPSGTEIFDWKIPDEWNIRGGYIADPSGRHVVDFKQNGLHVMGYSEPVDVTLPFSELRPHLHTLPDLPEAIPYRTSYYRRNWGFCLSQRQLDSMDPTLTYHVVIDAELAAGHLTLGESLIAGSSGSEFLISTYCCHPWMANDNLSGVIVTAHLQKWLASEPRRHSYRILMLPETIGAICYLAHNQHEMQNVDGGFVVSCCAGRGRFSIKPSFTNNSLVDRAAMLAFRDRNIDPWIRPFAPDGSDERQYSMPAFRIPVCTISKDKYYDYSFYHTSLDDPEFVTGENLLAALELYKDAIEFLEANHIYVSTMPYCEPQLGKRGLYPTTGGAVQQSTNNGGKSLIDIEIDALTWVMFLADGSMDLITMAERSGQPFRNLVYAATRLSQEGLLTIKDTSN